MATILIMDDDPGTRRMLRIAMEIVGHEVLEAGDGDEGLAELRKREVDVVVSDLVMPGKGGLEALMELRRSEKSLRIILMSGRIDMDTHAFRAMADQFGVDALLTKPFGVTQVLGAVEHALGERHEAGVEL